MSESARVSAERERALGGDASCVTRLLIVVVVRAIRKPATTTEKQAVISVCVLSVESVCVQCNRVCHDILGVYM